MAKWNKPIIISTHGINNSMCAATCVTTTYLSEEMLVPDPEVERQSLPALVQEMKHNYQEVQEIVKARHGRNYVNLRKVYAGAEEYSEQMSINNKHRGPLS